MEIGHLTLDGILGALGAVVGGAVGAGGAALGVFWQLRAERRERDAEAAIFREGVSDEVLARAKELIVVRTAIGAALEEKRYPLALDAVVYFARVSQPTLFRFAGERLHLLSETQRGALQTFYDALEKLTDDYQSTRTFGWQAAHLWPKQCEALREQCQLVCSYGADALAEMFGRGKEPQEAQLRDARYVDEPALRGARVAIEEHRKTVEQQQPQPGPSPAERATG